MDAITVIWQALRHFNRRGYIYIWANFAAVLCSIPLVTAPAAWAGLVKLSSEAYLSPSADLNDYWQGFRENLRRSLILSVLNLVVIGINISNLLAYRDHTDALSTIMRPVWLGALLLWIIVQMYTFPLLYRMEQPDLIRAMVNAVVMFYLNPIFTLVLLGVLIGIVLLSTVLMAAWLLLTVSLMAVIVTGAVLNRLQVEIYIPETLEGEALEA